nr:MAG TPA: hypothetical protein [Caudoviricetes sp.]
MFAYYAMFFIFMQRVLCIVSKNGIFSDCYTLKTP